MTRLPPLLPSPYTRLSLPFPPTYASSPLSFFNVFGLPTAAKVTLPRDPSLSLLLLLPQLGSLASSFPLFSPQGGCCCSSPNKTRRVVGGGRGSAEKKNLRGGMSSEKKKKQKWLFLGTAAPVVGVFYCPVGPIPRRRWRRTTTTGDSCFASLLFRNGHFSGEGEGRKGSVSGRERERVRRMGPFAPLPTAQERVFLASREARSRNVYQIRRALLGDTLSLPFLSSLPPPPCSEKTDPSSVMCSLVYTVVAEQVAAGAETPRSLPLLIFAAPARNARKCLSWILNYKALRWRLESSNKDARLPS